MKEKSLVFKTRKLLTLTVILILLKCFTQTASAELRAKSVLDIPLQHYSDIACSNDGHWVIVGDYGLIKTSKDLKKWSIKDPGIDRDFTSCCWGGDKLVVATKYGVILCSNNDGDNWTITETSYNLGPVTWYDNKFFTIADDYNILTSPDGINWTSVYKFKDDFPVAKIEHLNNIFVAYGSGKIAVSQDGKQWKVKEFDAGEIIWDGKQYVTVGFGTQNWLDTDSDACIWTSQNALDWTKLVSNVDDLAFIDNITFFRNKYYATVSIKGFKYIISSNDLKYWAKVNEKPYTTITKFLTADNYLCALGYYQSYVETSDGRQWQLTQSYKPDLLKVLWNGSAFLAIGNNGTVTLSEDGENWSEPVEVPADGILKSAIWTGREFYIATTIPNIEEDKFWVNKVNFYKSADGKAWTLVSSIPDNNIDNIFYTNNRFFAVSTHGTIFSSTDGMNWQKGKVPVEEWFRGIASNGNKFVCVGQGKSILTSSDGIQWEEQKIEEYTEFDYVIWNGKIFVAVGRYGTIATSPDGVRWTFGKLPAGGTDGGLWDGERFVFVGEYNDIFTTKDFRDFKKLSYDSLVNSIVWNGERYVMVGDSAEITTWIPNDIVKVKVNNSPVVFDVAPKVINGRTLLPIRAVTEKMGADLNWDSATQTVEVIKGNTKIKMVIGSRMADVNGRPVVLDSPATTIDGRTLVPLRFVAENLGAKVTWDSATQTVIIEN